MNLLVTDAIWETTATSAAAPAPTPFSFSRT